MLQAAFDHTSWKRYDAKYHLACKCLRKDREQLLTFYDFPAEYWAHLRATNPIESNQSISVKVNADSIWEIPAHAR